MCVCVWGGGLEKGGFMFDVTTVNQICDLITCVLNGCKTILNV